MTEGRVDLNQCSLWRFSFLPEEPYFGQRSQDSSEGINHVARRHHVAGTCGSVQSRDSRRWMDVILGAYKHPFYFTHQHIHTLAKL